MYVSQRSGSMPYLSTIIKQVHLLFCNFNVANSVHDIFSFNNDFSSSISSIIRKTILNGEYFVYIDPDCFYYERLYHEQE